MRLMQQGIPFVTEDRDLLKKFAGLAVSMDGFLKAPSIKAVHEERAEYRLRKS